MHAFVNIKQLLKKDETETIGGESPRDKALRLALANNFVTELTSLVVIAGKDVKIASLSDQASSGQFNSYPSHPVGGYQHSMMNSVQHSVQNSVQQKTAHHGISPQSLYPPSHSPGLSAQSAWSPHSYNSVPSYNMMSAPSYDSYDLYEDDTNSVYDDKDLMMDYSLKSQERSLSKVKVCSGAIHLFSKTYNRGTNVTITEDTANLEKLQFVDQLVSLSVTGDCCWEVFTMTNYHGNSKKFTISGTFLSTTSVGPVFRNAKSIKKC